MVYVPVKQVGPGGAAVILRSRLDPAGLVATVRREVQQIDPDQAVANPRTVDQMLTEASWPFRVFGTLFGILAFIALTLASVGLYAVIAYSVSTRTQEIGVRMALGAGRGTVGWLVLRRGLWQLAIGLTPRPGRRVGRRQVRPRRASWRRSPAPIPRSSSACRCS